MTSCLLICTVSPLKKSRGAGNQCYDGKVCDGTQTLRFVGFSRAQKKQLDDFLAMKWPFFFKIVR